MKNLIWILVLTIVPGTFYWMVPVRANMRSAYFDTLKVAQSKIERSKRRAGGESALSSSFIGQFLGRPYRVGDSWKVAVWAKDSSIMRQTGEPERMTPRHGRGGIFQYEVIGTKNGVIDLRVTQLAAPGSPAIDARVRSIALTISTEGGGFTPAAKTYKLAEGRGDFTASAEGLHAPVSYLELLPLEAPDLTSAVRGEAKAVPELPPQLSILTDGATLMLDPERAARFEQDDFFGRSVEAIWRQGDPWPVYMKTANGIAVLIVGDSR